jgi:hypothetical protein
LNVGFDHLSEIDSDLEAWMKYDEDRELYATTLSFTVDERLREFDEMLDSGATFKEIWEERVYKSLHMIHEAH